MRLPFLRRKKSGSLQRKLDARRLLLEPLEARHLMAAVGVYYFAPDGSENGGNVTFYVTRSPDTTGDLVVNYSFGSGGATEGTDFPTQSGSVTIPNGQTDEFISFVPTNDGLDEGTEAVIINLEPSANYTITDGTATQYILDNDVNVAVTPVAGEIETCPTCPCACESSSGEASSSGIVAADWRPRGSPGPAASSPIWAGGSAGPPGTSSIVADGSLGRAAGGGMAMSPPFIGSGSLGGLRYDSSSAQPIGIMQVDADFGHSLVNGSDIEVQFFWNGDSFPTKDKYYGTAQLDAFEDYRFAAAVDASSLGTGYYPWMVDVITYNPYTFMSESHQVSSGTKVVDRSQGEFGSGWSSQWVDRLKIQSNGAFWTLGDGRSFWFSKDQFGNYHRQAGEDNYSTLNFISSQYILTKQDGEKLTFNSSGLQTQREDRYGNQITYAYTDADSDSVSDEISTLTDYAGRVTTFGYTSGLVTSITDAYSNVTTLGYSSGKLTTITEPDPDAGGPLSAPVTTYAYTGGILSSITDPEGNVTEFNVTSVPDGVSFVSSTEHPGSAVEDIQAIYALALASNTVLVKVADLIEVREDALGNDLATERDAFGNPIKTTDADGNTTLIQRDSEGRPIQITTPDPDGVGGETAYVTTFTYDANGNPDQITHPDSSVQNWLYDLTFNVPTEYIDQLGNKTLFDLDPTYGYVLEERRVIGNVDDGINLETDDIVTTFTYTAAPTTSGDPPAGHLASMTDALGRVTEFDYDEFGNLLLVTYAVGTALEASIEYEYTDDLVTASIDELGRRTEYVYDKLRRLIETTLPDPDGAGPLASPVYAYEYDKTNNIVAIIDPLGRETSYTYDDRGNRTHVTRPDHDGDTNLTVTEYVYNLANQLETLIDPLGRETDFAYADNGWLLSTTLPDPDAGGVLTSPVFSTTYDALGRTKTTTDALGNVTTYAYSNWGKTVTITLPDPDGVGGASSPVVVMEYDAAGNLISETDALNNETTYAYDELARPTLVTLPDPDGVGGASAPETEYQYDKLGNLRFVIDPLANVTENVYDERNRLVTIIQEDPDGGGALTAPETDYAYDDAGQLTSVTDPLGRVTTNLYDNLGRLITVTLPDPDGFGGAAAPEHDYEYDAASRLISVTDALGNVTEYAYDALDNLVETTLADPDGGGGLASPVLESVFDATGQLLKSIDALARETDYEYDALGRRTKVTQPDPDGAGGAARPFSTFTYDAMGNLLTVTDPLSFVTEYAYDNLYRRMLITDAELGETSFTYDANGQLLSLTDPESNTTSWDYDNLGRKIEETNELSEVRTFKYDAVGNLIERVDRLGRKIVWEYDNLYRNNAEKWYSGMSLVHSILFDYDEAGQLLEAYDTGSSYGYIYDGLGRVTNESQGFAGFSPLLVYERDYDDLSRVTDIRAIIGGTADFENERTYDNLSRLTRLDQSGYGGNAVAEKRIDFSYNALGQFDDILRYADLAGSELVVTTGFNYDGMNRLASLTHLDPSSATLAGYDFVYDTASRIDSIDSFLDGLTQYSHDDTNQLTAADHAAQTDETYSYDANGNRTMSGYVVGTNNRITSDGTYDYEYDDEGNLTAMETISTGERVEYAWDHRNRLIEVEFKNALGTVTKRVEHAYDAFNRWIHRSIDPDGDTGSAATVDSFFSHLDGQIALEFDGATASDLAVRHLWNAAAIDHLMATEEISSVATPGDVLWALTDHLGTVRDIAEYDAVLNDTTIVNHRTYSSFGVLLSESNASFTILIGFTGRPLDTSTGFQNNLNRWYISWLGVWASEDPIGFGALDPNLRRYSENSPAQYVDPSGLVKGLPDASCFDLGDKALVIDKISVGLKVEVEAGGEWYPKTMDDLEGDIKWIKDYLKDPKPADPAGDSKLAQKLRDLLNKLDWAGDAIVTTVKSALPTGGPSKGLHVTGLKVGLYLKVKGTEYEVGGYWGLVPCLKRRWEKLGEREEIIDLGPGAAEIEPIAAGGVTPGGKWDNEKIIQALREIYLRLQMKLSRYPIDAKERVILTLEPDYSTPPIYRAE